MQKKPFSRPTSETLINTIDTALRTLFATPQSARAHPDAEINDLQDADLTATEKEQIVSLMRVNHTGEVCAQALYSGQALTARNERVVNALKHAAIEETEHLAWCETRIKSLGGRTSLLNPIFYMGALSMGAIAGALGDKWNLGFLAETEKQVEAHLEKHLQTIPESDQKTRKILAQMQLDEAKHAKEARHHGGVELPKPVQAVMKGVSKVMTTTSYFV